MAGRKRALTVIATHSYVRDDEAANQALDMWARYLASNLGPQLNRQPGTSRRPATKRGAP